MEGRRDTTGANLPSSPLFGHSSSPDPYMEELLQGLVNPNQPSPSVDGQTGFQPWSAYGEEGSFQQPNFMGWNSFRPTLDLSSAARNSSHLPAAAFPSCDDYLNSLSQPESNSDSSEAGGGYFYSAGHDSLLSGQNLGAAAESGRHLYAEALNHWVNYTGKTYEPFGRPDVFQQVDGETSPPEPCAPEASAATSSASVSKPSYSEVARNQPSHQSSTTNRPKSGANTPPSDDSRFPEFPNAHHGASHRPHGHRHKSGRSHGTKPKSPTLVGSDNLTAANVRPSSRMGLDHFEDMRTAKERYRQQLSCEDGSNPQSRKGSASSVGSGSSGLEEINFMSRPHSAGSSFSQDEPPGLGGGCDAVSCDSLASDSPVGGTSIPKTKSKKATRPRAVSSSLPTSEPCRQEKSFPGPAGSNQAKLSTEDTGAKKKAFFDPKRIFDPKVSKPASVKVAPCQTKSGEASNAALTPDTHVPNNQNQGPTKEKASGSGSVLNNGKPKSNLYTTNNVHAKPATTHYINNDLRQPTKKQTNTEGRNSPNRSAPKWPSTHSDSAPTPSPADPPDVRPPGVPPGVRRKQDHSTKKSSDSRPHPKRVRRYREASVSHRGELLVQSWEWCKWVCTELMRHAQSIFLLVLKVALALLAVGLSGVIAALNQLWQWLRIKIPYLRPKVTPEENDSFDWSNPSSQSRFKTVGLEKNITLPTTGEEAMKRLLACKGKDPYSILGVRVDSPDEEIKRYYRKQAVLVHPDKNKIPGAEEAFKILGHSFDIVGEPEKRSKYDAQRLETQETETAMHEFADLLTKLRSKMQEAVNLMRCEKCGGRHRRVPVDRPWYNARFCDRCNQRHSAKEGDVWAESRVMGFLWHYYACMEGKIYDITEWASCQSGNFKHIQANAHHVIYRIATQAGARQRSQSNSGRGNNEPDLEDFINHLFHRSGRTDANPSENTPQHPAQNPAAAAASAAANAAKKRRKKKKH